MGSATPVFTDRDNRFLITGAVGDLELMTRKGQNPAGANSGGYEDCLVLICHPNPQQGGTMDNKVVTTVARAARDLGLDSLRFNYRGVGKSEGSYGHFDGECEDLDAVINWLRLETGKSRLILAGFSFGSAVIAARSNQLSETIHAIFIAPPVDRHGYPHSFTVPVSVIQGAEDEVVEADAVTDWVRSLNSSYDYYYSGQTSHFFHGKLVQLRQKLVSILSAAIA